MNRKDFLAKGGLLAAASMLPGLAGAASGNAMGTQEAAAIIPPSLGAGDLIGITSPAGYITHEEIEPAIRLLREWGFRVKIGQTIGKRHHTFGGTDEERLGDLQQMLDAPDLKAILCARGGYGAVRIVDQLRWNRFRQHPKWVIGFSDITVLHAHLNRQVGGASIHSKMCNSFPEDLSLAEPFHAGHVTAEGDDHVPVRHRHVMDHGDIRHFHGDAVGEAALGVERGDVQIVTGQPRGLVAECDHLAGDRVELGMRRECLAAPRAAEIPRTAGFERVGIVHGDQAIFTAVP